MRKITIYPAAVKRDFVKSIKGIYGGQWGEGFLRGVDAFQHYLSRRHARITLAPKKDKSK